MLDGPAARISRRNWIGNALDLIFLQKKGSVLKKPALISALSLVVIALWAMACASPPPPPLPKLYTINSSPAGAAVKLDGAALGNTPLNFRKDGVATLTIELSGYKTITTGIGPNSPQILNFTLEKDAPTTFTRTL